MENNGNTQYTDTISVLGILSKGFGFSPQLVARNPNLSLEAKGVYLYLSSFAGSGARAFPSKSLMCAELNATRERLNKYLKQLVNYGYIVIEQKKDNQNRFMRNEYIMVQNIPAGKYIKNTMPTQDFPSPDFPSPDFPSPGFPYTGNQTPPPLKNVDKPPFQKFEARNFPSTEIPATEIPATEIPSTENHTTNSNSIKNTYITSCSLEGGYLESYNSLEGGEVASQPTPPPIAEIEVQTFIEPEPLPNEPFMYDSAGNPIDAPSSMPITKWETYGENNKVRLTTLDYDILVKKHGSETIDDFIFQMDNSITRGTYVPKLYENHRATIERWIYNDKKQKKDRPTITGGISVSASGFVPKTNPTPKVNRFVNFKQRDWDYTGLESKERQYINVQAGEIIPGMKWLLDGQGNKVRMIPA